MLPREVCTFLRSKPTCRISRRGDGRIRHNMRIDVLPDDPLPPPAAFDGIPPLERDDEDYVPNRDAASGKQNHESESSSESDAPTSDSDADHRSLSPSYKTNHNINNHNRAGAPVPKRRARGGSRGGGHANKSNSGQKRKRGGSQSARGGRGGQHQRRPASDDFIPAAAPPSSSSVDNSEEVKNQGPPKRPRRAAAPTNLSDDTGDQARRNRRRGADYEDEREVGGDDEEDEGPRFTAHPDDAWLHQGLSEEDLKNMDPTGFLKTRHQNWANIEANPYLGQAEATDDTGNTTYCYLCENPRRSRFGTDDSLHYDTIKGFLNGFQHMPMHCATFFAVKYYDQYVYPATRKVMTQPMFMNHILKHDPNAPLLHKWMLVHTVDVELMIRESIKPLRPGEPPDRDNIRMMHANHKELRQCIAAMQKART